jgi:tetratricopeptide (TPR) repeat protein
LYDAQKKFDLSEKQYREVLRIDDTFAPAANNLAFLLADQSKKLDEALMLAQKAKERLPEDPSIMDTLGWVYYKRGLYDSAIAEFIGSIEKLPNNASVQYHLGMAYYKKEDSKLAREHLRRALQLGNDFNGADEARKILSMQ